MTFHNPKPASRSSPFPPLEFVIFGKIGLLIIPEFSRVRADVSRVEEFTQILFAPELLP